MGRRLEIALGVVCCAAALSCGEGGLSRASIAGISGKVAQIAAAMTGQEAVIADEVASATHLGFDTGVYPGDAAMRAWRTGGSPYEWAGYYLPSPCHPDDGWSGKRETLTAMGYGLAVLYVGQQTWGRTPGKPYKVPVKVTKRVKTRVGHGKKGRTAYKSVTRTVWRKAPPPGPTETCNADFVSATRGAKEGFDAVTRAARENFPTGTTVFLDIERMDYLPQAMREYYSAWVRTVLADGRFRPGIYVHTDNANLVHADVKQAYAEAGISDEPPFWIAKATGFDINKLPSEMGHTFAAVWQGVLDVEQTWAGHKIPIDINVSHSRSPSTAFTYLSAAITGSRALD
jgi:hypothetical protein